MPSTCPAVSAALPCSTPGAQIARDPADLRAVVERGVPLRGVHRLVVDDALLDEAAPVVGDLLGGAARRCRRAHASPSMPHHEAPACCERPVNQPASVAENVPRYFVGSAVCSCAAASAYSSHVVGTARPCFCEDVVAVVELHGAGVLRDRRRRRRRRGSPSLQTPSGNWSGDVGVDSCRRCRRGRRTATSVGIFWYSAWMRSGAPLPALIAVSSLVTAGSPPSCLLTVTWMSGLLGVPAVDDLVHVGRPGPVGELDLLARRDAVRAGVVRAVAAGRAAAASNAVAATTAGA